MKGRYAPLLPPESVQEVSSGFNSRGVPPKGRFESGSVAEFRVRRGEGSSPSDLFRARVADSLITYGRTKLVLMVRVT